MKLEFKPYVGVGPLTFGLSRQEVHQILGEPDAEGPEIEEMELEEGEVGAEGEGSEDDAEQSEVEMEIRADEDQDEYETQSQGMNADGAFREFFASKNLFVEYDEDEKLEAIEIMSPAALTYGALKLLETPYNQLVKHFQAQDHELNIDALGFTSKKFGICVYYTAAVDFSDQPVDQIKLFKKDYTGELYP